MLHCCWAPARVYRAVLGCCIFAHLVCCSHWLYFQLFSSSLWLLKSRVTGATYLATAHRGRGPIMAPKRKAPGWRKAVVPIVRYHAAVRPYLRLSPPVVLVEAAHPHFMQRRLQVLRLLPRGQGGSILALPISPSLLSEASARPALPSSTRAVGRDAPKATSHVGRGVKHTTPLTNEDRASLLVEHEFDTRTRSARNAGESNWKTWAFDHVR